MKVILGGLISGIAFVFLLVFVFGGFNESGLSSMNGGNNVTIVDGKQIVEITARGGYFPRVSLAKAGMPTILRIKTKGTFDCSGSIVIPAINYSENLPMSGVTDVDLGVVENGKNIQGLCSMGMYSFEVNFE